MALLTWSQGAGRAGTDSLMVDIADKPSLPFDYTALYYEPDTGMRLKITPEGASVALSATEEAHCAALAPVLVEAADYPVQAYAEDGVYMGELLKSAVRARGLNSCLDAPDHPASKRVGEAWQRVVAVIMDSGTLRQMPDSICQLCVMHFTEEEWQAFPKPATAYETWDFASESWQDKRDLATTKSHAKALVRRVMEEARQRWLGDIPQWERDTWPRQEAEARAWLADTTSPTPFVDAALAGRGSALTKADYCADIVANAAKAWARLAHAHNKQWTWFDSIESAVSLSDVDALALALSDVDLSTEAQTWPSL